MEIHCSSIWGTCYLSGKTGGNYTSGGSDISMTRKNSKSRDAKAKRKKPEKLEFVQPFLPVKDIQNGIVETTDGRYVKILEIEPINFMLRSSEEQYNILSSFASWLKISPMRLQFKSITRKADSDKHIAMMREEMAYEDNEECKALSEDYIRLKL